MITYIRRSGWLGVAGSQEVAGKTHAVWLHLYCGSTGAGNGPKVIKSVGNHTARPCETLQSGHVCSTASKNS